MIAALRNTIWLGILLCGAAICAGCDPSYKDGPDPILDFHADRYEFDRIGNIKLEFRYRSKSESDCYLTDNPEFGSLYMEKNHKLGIGQKAGSLNGQPVWRQSVTVAPHETTKYRAVCGISFGFGSVHTLTITVPSPEPNLIAFIASPETIDTGDPVTLIWAVTGANACTIEPTGGEAEVGAGSLIVYPDATTTYSLICNSADRIASKFTVVTVNP